MKVYLLYETKDADEYGFGKRDDIVGIYATRPSAEAARRIHIQNAKKYGQDYAYNVISEKVL